jgi:hypothetical protein
VPRQSEPDERSPFVHLNGSPTTKGDMRVTERLHRGRHLALRANQNGYQIVIVNALPLIDTYRYDGDRQRDRTGRRGVRAR